MNFATFKNTIDTLVDDVNEKKKTLTRFWCLLNANMYPEFNKDEVNKIMNAIQDAVTKDYCV